MFSCAVSLCLEPGPGAVMVGNLLRGTRIGEASGREIGEVSDADKRVWKQYDIVELKIVSFLTVRRLF